MNLSQTGKHEAGRLDTSARPTSARRVAIESPTRRRWMQTAGALALAPVTRRAYATPIDTLKIVIGAHTGAQHDLVGRSLGAAMIAAGQAQRAVYDNKSGYAGIAALLDFASEEPSSPSSLVVVGADMVGSIDTGEALDALRRVTPIARLATNTMAIVVPSSSPIRQVSELLRRVQAQPSAITWAGSSHRGSLEHVLLALLGRELRVPPARLNYVPLASAKQMAAALRDGHAQVGIAPRIEVLPLAATGELRMLALSSGSGEANVPSLRQANIDVDVGQWRGVFAPKGLAPDGVGQLIDAVRQAVNALSWRQALNRNGWIPAPLYGQAFGQFVQDERRRFQGVLDELGIVRSRTADRPARRDSPIGLA